MIYYEFDRTGNGKKYREMTAEEYDQAKNTPGRWFLEGWSENHKKLLYVMECTYEEFDRARKEADGILKRQRDRSNRKAPVLPLEEDMIECSEEFNVLGNGNHASIDEAVLTAISRKTVRKEILDAISTLPSLERMLVFKVYFEEKTQTQAATELGITQQKASYRMRKALKMLAALLKDLDW